jgi:hypothetical protein
MGLTLCQRPITATPEGLFVGANPGAPTVGDLRVRWEAAPPGVVTVLAAQRGATFDDRRTPSGRTIEQNLEVGPKSAAEMFGALEAGNTFLTWVLRFVGWLFPFIGVSLVVRPLVVVADVLPFPGSLVGADAGLAGFVIASPLALITVAVRGRSTARSHSLERPYSDGASTGIRADCWAVFTVCQSSWRMPPVSPLLGFRHQYAKLRLFARTYDTIPVSHWRSEVVARRVPNSPIHTGARPSTAR